MAEKSLHGSAGNLRFETTGSKGVPERMEANRLQSFCRDTDFPKRRVESLRVIQTSGFVAKNHKI
jgi:hypothetical protein